MKKREEQGFTLVELSMSLVFVAFIILFLTITLLNIMQTYNKGIWLNQINLAGRQINSDVGDQVRFSSNTVTIRNDIQRLCVGSVAYIWNTADDLDKDNPNHLGKMAAKNWFNGESTENTKLRFVRVFDSTGTDKYCASSNERPNRNDSNTSAMLGPGVVIQKFDVTEGTTGLLRIQAVFSTENDVQPEYNSATKHYQCKIAGKFTADNNQFCAFAEFDIITYRRLGE